MKYFQANNNMHFKIYVGNTVTKSGRALQFHQQ